MAVRTTNTSDELSMPALVHVLVAMSLCLRCDIPPGLTVLEVAEKNGIVIPYGCRQGQCGTCATRLSEGAVRMESEADCPTN